MTAPWDRGRNGPAARGGASGDAGTYEPVADAGMSADIHHDATVLTLVGRAAYCKIVVWEVWS